MSNNGVGGYEGAQGLLVKYGPIVGLLVIGGGLAVAGLSRVGCDNHHVDPGHEGYVRSKPIAGSAKFVTTIPGPGSTGWVWRQEVTSIDMRPKTYPEKISINTNEGQTTLNAYALIQLRSGSVREVVEKLGGANWYTNNVQEQFKSEVLKRCQSLKPLEVKNNMSQIAADVLRVMKERHGEGAVEFLDVFIGNISYPPSVVEAVSRKAITRLEDRVRRIEAQIAVKQIEVGGAEAEGERNAQEIIRKTLDPMYLQYEALGAIEELGKAPNNTFLVVPYSETGSSPLIMNLGGDSPAPAATQPPRTARAN